MLDLPIAYTLFGVSLGTPPGDIPQFDGGCMRDYGSIRKDFTGSASILVPGGVHTVGRILHVPGKGLSGFPGRTLSPSSGISDPKSDWVSGGQQTDYTGRCAEVVIAPDGTKYKFGRHAIRKGAVLDIPVTIIVRNGTPPQPYHEWIFHNTVSRKYAVHLITEVEDVHGNWVRYEYTNSERAELTRIVSNDDREINLTMIILSRRSQFATLDAFLILRLTAADGTMDIRARQRISIEV